MQNLLEVIGVNQGLLSRPAGGATLAGLLITDPLNGTALAMLASIGYMVSGSTFALAHPVALTASTKDILVQKNSQFALQVANPGEWTVQHAPAAATRATATKAGVANSAFVCRSFLVTLSADAMAETVPRQFVIRDGATGVGAILYTGRIAVPANQSRSVEMSGLNIVGTPGNAMTIEFTTAPDANHFETVSMSGVEAFTAQ